MNLFMHYQKISFLVLLLWQWRSFSISIINVKGVELSEDVARCPIGWQSQPRGTYWL